MHAIGNRAAIVIGTSEASEGAGAGQTMERRTQTINVTCTVNETKRNETIGFLQSLQFCESEEAIKLDFNTRIILSLLVTSHGVKALVDACPRLGQHKRIDDRFG